MVRTEIWYVWKLLIGRNEEERGDAQPCLITPCLDPHTYEYPYDYMFKTEKEALDALEGHDVMDEALEDNWVLCKMTLEVVSKARDCG